jgi:ADP-ribose pyrophosphatase YjhB (NUDIX family)
MADEPLFKKGKNKQITAFDLFDKKHKRWLNDFKFRPSAYGVLQNRDKILVQRHPLLHKFGFPGGGIEMDESISEGLIREYEEETGLKVKVGKLLGISEDFFTFKGTDIHGILIYYEVEKTGGEILPSGNGQDTGEVKFIEIEKLTKETSSRSQWKFIKSYKSTFRE